MRWRRRIHVIKVTRSRSDRQTKVTATRLKRRWGRQWRRNLVCQIKLRIMFVWFCAKNRGVMHCLSVTFILWYFCTRLFMFFFMRPTTNRCVGGVMFLGCPSASACFHACIWAYILLACYLTSQFTEFHQNVVNFEGRRVKVNVATRSYEGRSKSFEPNPFKRKVDKWAYLYFSAYSPPLSVHSL